MRRRSSNVPVTAAAAAVVDGKEGIKGRIVRRRAEAFAGSNAPTKVTVITSDTVDATQKEKKLVVQKEKTPVAAKNTRAPRKMPSFTPASAPVGDPLAPGSASAPTSAVKTRGRVSSIEEGTDVDAADDEEENGDG